MKLINSHLAESIEEQAMLATPNALGYIFIGAEIEPTHPFRKSEKKKRLELQLKNKIEFFKNTPGVQRADLFSSFIIPPGSEEGLRVLQKKNIDIQPAKFDIVILIETASIENLDRIENDSTLRDIEYFLEDNAQRIYKTKAQNKLRIAEVDKDTNGVFLFNYFYCKDRKAVLDVWKYTAGWWTAKANLTNSTPLSPFDENGPFSLINHCKWNSWSEILPILILGKLGIIKGLNNFVLKNFTANEIVAMPVLYKLVK